LADVKEVFDFKQIDFELRAILESQRRWTYYLARNGLSALHLSYEDVVRSPQEAAEAVADLVGLEERPLADMSKVKFRPQRDAMNDEWRKRYLARARNLRRFD